MSNSSKKVAAGAVLVLVAAFTFGISGTALAGHVQCGDVITQSTTLDADVGPCLLDGIIIGADNITLDLNGHTVSGGPTSGDGRGIGIQGRTGVTVKNGTVEMFDVGVKIVSGSGNVVRDLTVQNNIGIQAGGTTLEGGDGILIDTSSNNQILNNLVQKNGPFGGITVFVENPGPTALAANNLIGGNSVIDNDIDANPTLNSDQGIRIEGPGAQNNTIENNVVRRSGLDGIVVFAVGGTLPANSGNIIRNNVVEENGGHNKTHRKGGGILLGGRASQSVIEDNQVHRNAADGIRVASLNNLILSNVSTGNNVANEPAPRLAFDLHDAILTPPCDNNKWLGNVFVTFNQPCVTGGPQADLSISKSDSPDPANLGEEVTYSLAVSNAGLNRATDVALTDTLPAAMGFLSASASQGSCSESAGTVTCNLGTLERGASASVTIVAEPTSTGTHTNTATVASAATDPSPANNSATTTTTVNNANGCTILGTSGNDVLIGTIGMDVICAFGGNDTVMALDGDDRVLGGSGNDDLAGGSGADRLEGGRGNDVLKGDNGIDTLIGGSGADSLLGGNGDDSLDGVDGVSGNDTLDGQHGADTCTADPGDVKTSC